MIKLNKFASKLSKGKFRHFSIDMLRKSMDYTFVKALENKENADNVKEYNNFVMHSFDMDKRMKILNQFITECISRDSAFLVNDPYNKDDNKNGLFNHIQDLAYIASNKLSDKEKHDFIKNLTSINDKLNVGIRTAYLKSDFYGDLFKKKLMKVVEGSAKENELHHFINNLNVKRKEFCLIVKILLGYDLNDTEWDFVFDNVGGDQKINDIQPNQIECEITMGESINYSLNIQDTDDMILIDKGDEELDFVLDKQIHSSTTVIKASSKPNLPLLEEYNIEEEIQTIADSITNALEIENFQEYREDTILTHKFEHKPTNWLYLMDLPYDFNEDKYKKLISQRFKAFGNVKQIIFQKYCYHVTKLEESKVIFYDTNDMTDAHKFIDDNSPSKENKTDKVSTAQKLHKLDNNSSLSMLNRNSGNRILSKMDKEKSKYRKSYALVEMETYEQKLNVISPFTRVYGIYMEDKCSKIEDADYKYSIVLDNLPYGYKMKKVLDTVNTLLLSRNIEEFSVNETAGNKMIINSSITLEFKDFETALKAFTHLKGITIFDRYIKVDFIYGNLKEVDGVFIEAKKSNIKKSIAKNLSEINKLEKDAIHQQDKLSKVNSFSHEASDDILLNIMQDFSRDVLVNTFDTFEMIEGLKIFDHIHEENETQHINI